MDICFSAVIDLSVCKIQIILDNQQSWSFVRKFMWAFVTAVNFTAVIFRLTSR